jgi:hypothetical protein
MLPETPTLWVVEVDGRLWALCASEEVARDVARDLAAAGRTPTVRPR